MDSPILTPVSWAKGKYDTYSHHLINPPGLANGINKDHQLTVDDNILFLSSRNQRCKGKWFVSALLEHEYHSYHPGESFHCHLILVMGVKSLAKSLMDPEVTVFYHKLHDDLGQLTIPEMIKSSHNPEHFIRQAFHPLLEQSLARKLYRRYLNQISVLVFYLLGCQPIN